jgi:hypothetical protein
MTVHVVTCCDPADRGTELWAHGAYATKAQAMRVVQRLKRDGYWTVRINALRVQPKPEKPR